MPRLTVLLRPRASCRRTDGRLVVCRTHPSASTAAQARAQLSRRRRQTVSWIPGLRVGGGESSTRLNRFHNDRQRLFVAAEIAHGDGEVVQTEGEVSVVGSWIGTGEGARHLWEDNYGVHGARPAAADHRFVVRPAGRSVGYPLRVDMSPRAFSIACRRSATCSLRRMLLTWFRTVIGEMTRLRAMSALLRPSAR